MSWQKTYLEQLILWSLLWLVTWNCSAGQIRIQIVSLISRKSRMRCASYIGVDQRRVYPLSFMLSCIQYQSILVILHSYVRMLSLLVFFSKNVSFTSLRPFYLLFIYWSSHFFWRIRGDHCYNKLTADDFLIAFYAFIQSYFVLFGVWNFCLYMFTRSALTDRFASTSPLPLAVASR